MPKVRPVTVIEGPTTTEREQPARAVRRRRRMRHDRFDTILRRIQDRHEDRMASGSATEGETLSVLAMCARMFASQDSAAAVTETCAVDLVVDLVELDPSRALPAAHDRREVDPPPPAAARMVTSVAPTHGPTLAA